jgi:hypothetical protein
MRKRTRLNKQIAKSTSDLKRQRLVNLHNEIELRLQDSHRIEEQAAEERVVEVIRENSKYFFKYAQSKAKIKTPVGPLKDNDVLVRDDQGMCELLGSQFESVSSNPRYSSEENEIEVLLKLLGRGGWRTLSLGLKIWK